MGTLKAFPFAGDECDRDLGGGELASETTAVLLAGDLSSHSASTFTGPAVGERSTMCDAMHTEVNRIYVIV